MLKALQQEEAWCLKRPGRRPCGCSKETYEEADHAEPSKTRLGDSHIKYCLSPKATLRLYDFGFGTLQTIFLLDTGSLVSYPNR